MVQVCILALRLKASGGGSDPHDVDLLPAVDVERQQERDDVAAGAVEENFAHCTSNADATVSSTGENLEQLG